MTGDGFSDDRRSERATGSDDTAEGAITDGGDRGDPEQTRHSVSLAIPEDDRLARIVTAAISGEEGEMPDDRSQAHVRSGDEAGTVEIAIDAADLVALRASCNTWLRLVEVAETTGRLACGDDRQ